MSASPPATSSPPRDCDIAVIGGGIVGLATARELKSRHPDASVALLERESAIATHQTGHSSGVIHAGIYYRPGSLKARLCVEGARELYEYCEERGIRAERAGKVIVATEPGELTRLDELERRGRENQVPGLRRIDADELREIEPHATGIAALHSPATGVVDFRVVAASLASELTEAGGTIATGFGVEGISAGSDGVSLRHADGELRAKTAVFCAGLWSDRLAVMAGAPADPRIVPFRGAYLSLKPQRRDLVRTSIYPVPDPDLPFLGVHLTRDLDGSVHVGPSALMVGARDAYGLTRFRARDLASTLAWPGTWRMMRRYWRTGATEMRRAFSRRAFASEAARFVPELRPRDFTAGRAGVRGQALARDGALVDDFVVSQTEHTTHVRNAPSPAATSCLALARLIADHAEAELGVV
jgi:2-hydroxyglutarate dehydrogenase